MAKIRIDAIRYKSSSQQYVGREVGEMETMPVTVSGRQGVCLWRHVQLTPPTRACCIVCLLCRANKAHKNTSE